MLAASGRAGLPDFILYALETLIVRDGAYKRACKSLVPAIRLNRKLHLPDWAS